MIGGLSAHRQGTRNRPWHTGEMTIYSKATLSAKYKTAGYPDKKLLDAAVTGGS